MEKDAVIYLAGHKGLLGSEILNMLKEKGYKNIITRSHQELDLLGQTDVENFFKTKKPEYVILTAAKVGGIKANISYPAQFIYENITIQSNIIHASYLYKVKKLLFFGSACSYPRDCPQPMKEEYLLSGYLEPTNEPYAVAKIAGIKMCEAYNHQYKTNFISVIPTNIYGPNDDFESENSHVISALIRRFHEARVKRENKVTVWGTGNPKREFLYVADLAEACIYLMKNYNEDQFINVGTGKEIAIREVTNLIKETVGYKGDVGFDPTKPDGMPRRVLDVSRINNLGWQASTHLSDGISMTYKWYLEHIDKKSSEMNINE